LLSQVRAVFRQGIAALDGATVGRAGLGFGGCRHMAICP
jgi:hypothetical protein